MKAVLPQQEGAVGDDVLRIRPVDAVLSYRRLGNRIVCGKGREMQKKRRRLLQGDFENIVAQSAYADLLRFGDLPLIEQLPIAKKVEIAGVLRGCLRVQHPRPGINEILCRYRASIGPCSV